MNKYLVAASATVIGIVITWAILPVLCALPVTIPGGGSTFTDTTADFVLGQPNFTASNFATTATELRNAADIAFDSAGRLYVCDQSSNRVLVFENPTSGDTTADKVFGQADFTSNAAAVTSTGMDNPNGVAFDSAGRLFVTDFGNRRYSSLKIRSWATRSRTKSYASRTSLQMTPPRRQPA